jgi:hypothetical protein
MQSPLVLSAEATAPANRLNLLLTVPEQFNFRSNRAPVSRVSFEFEVDPLVLWRGGVLINKEWTSLIGNEYI